MVMSVLVESFFFQPDAMLEKARFEFPALLVEPENGCWMLQVALHQAHGLSSDLRFQVEVKDEWVWCPVEGVASSREWYNDTLLPLAREGKPLRIQVFGTPVDGRNPVFWRSAVSQAARLSPVNRAGGTSTTDSMSLSSVTRFAYVRRAKEEYLIMADARKGTLLEYSVSRWSLAPPTVLFRGLTIPVAARSLPQPPPEVRSVVESASMSFPWWWQALTESACVLCVEEGGVRVGDGAVGVYFPRDNQGGEAKDAGAQSPGFYARLVTHFNCPRAATLSWSLGLFVLDVAPSDEVDAGFVRVWRIP